MRLAVVSALSLLFVLALRSSASADQSLAISFAGLETGELSAWDVGRTRFRIWLQADSCIRTTNKTKRAPIGEMNLTLAVSPAGILRPPYSSDPSPWIMMHIKAPSFQAFAPLPGIELRCAGGVPR